MHINVYRILWISCDKIPKNNELRLVYFYPYTRNVRIFSPILLWQSGHDVSGSAHSMHNRLCVHGSNKALTVFFSHNIHVNVLFSLWFSSNRVSLVWAVAATAKSCFLSCVISMASRISYSDGWQFPVESIHIMKEF